MDNKDVEEIEINKTDLKILIIEWLALDEQIKKHKNVIKELSDEKKQFEEKILNIMNLLEEDVIITEKGNIKKVKKEIKASITPNLIENTLKDILKSDETAKNYTNSIMDKREIKSIFNLKHLDIVKKKNIIK